MFEKVNELPGANPEKIMTSTVYTSMMIAALGHAKSIVLRRWAWKIKEEELVSEWKKEYTEEEIQEKLSEFNKSEGKEIFDCNLREYRQLLILRASLITYFNIKIDVEKDVVHEIEDNLEQILENKNIVDVKKEEEIFNRMAEEGKRMQELIAQSELKN
jgi:hypothetical protein